MTASHGRQGERVGAARPDIGQLFARHGEALCRTIHAMTGRREIAEDVVQDTFAYAHQHLDELTDGPGMRSWLFQVAIHRMRHDVRARGRYDARLSAFGAEPSTGIATPDDEARRLQDARRIQECVLAIPSPHREVFVLYEFEAFSGKEIAAALEIEVKTVWTRLHRARAAFRETWVARGYHE